MAKLTARGRTEILRMERVDLDPVLLEGFKVRTLIAVMSDRTILKNVKWNYADSSRNHETGWKKLARFKADEAVSRYKTQLEARGYTEVR